MTQDAVLHLMQAHGLWLVGPMAVIEGPIVTVIAAYLAKLGYMNIWAVYAVCVLGDLIGDRFRDRCAVVDDQAVTRDGGAAIRARTGGNRNVAGAIRAGVSLQLSARWAEDRSALVHSVRVAAVHHERARRRVSGARIGGADRAPSAAGRADRVGPSRT